MNLALVSDKTAPDGAASPLWQLLSVRSYLARIGAEPRSLRRAAVTRMVGRYPKTLGSVKFKCRNDEWLIDATSGCEPTETENAAMVAELKSADIPVWQPYLGRWTREDLPAPYSTLPESNLSILRASKPVDTGNNIANSRHTKFDHHPVLMVQARLDDNVGGKNYHPLTWWSDNRWHVAEPDRDLPVYGLEKVLYTSCTVAFLHEGTKAARVAQEIADAYNATPETRSPRERELSKHPWAFELAGGVHLGWIGGAMRAEETDWFELHEAFKRGQVARVVIVGDNDKAGRGALPKISRLLKCTADHLIFTHHFPESFDLADRFPSRAPSFAECLHPGTFLTELAPNKKGRPTPFLTEAGRAEYLYVPDVSLYVNRRHPRFAYDKERINAAVRPLSDAANTASLIEEAAYSSGRAVGLTYDPGQPSGIISDGEVSALNRHQPTTIRVEEGDVGPWLGFLEYLFPEMTSRSVVTDWCATLIGRPSIRMHYGLLLISETQGVGKTTLGDVMAELVGRHNASFPGENDILSPFNEWQAERRLAVINEIYTGHSWKAYNSLKTVMTDRFLTINRKHQRQYKVPNWLHIIACSNSSRPLKMEDGDRRWFVPQVAEVSWPHEKFAEFRAWLASGGYGIILSWAEAHGKYVQAGHHAPRSDAKDGVVAAGRSEAAQAVVRLAEIMADCEAMPLAVTLASVVVFARQAGGGRLSEDNQELASLLKRGGIKKWARIKVAGALENIFANDRAIAAAGEAGGNDRIKGFLRDPKEIAQGAM